MEQGGKAAPSLPTGRSTVALDALTTTPQTAGLPVDWGFEVVAVYPHDPEAFTQGLVWHRGRLLETTGQYGGSSVREVDLETGVVRRQRSLERRYFGEGLAAWHDRLIWLTWREQTAFVLGLEQFNFVGKHAFDGEGWGLTHDGRRLIMSDGTSLLRFRDPETFENLGAVMVMAGGKPLDRLNELEFVRGWILANIWGRDQLAIIDPATGAARVMIDFAALPRGDPRWSETDVMNGIAWNAEADRLFVTGKRWPELFEVRLTAAPAPPS